MTDQNIPMHIFFGAAKALALFKLALAAPTIAGWFRRDTKEEDEMVSAAHDVVLDALSDADATGVVDAITNQNWRDQVSVEEAEELNSERELRRFGWRRN